MNILDHETTKLRKKEVRAECQNLCVHLPRSTNQHMIIILFDQNSNCFEKFRNTMVLHQPIALAYGSGRCFGISERVKAVEGFFRTCHRVAILGFDCKDQAKKFIQSKLHVIDAKEFGGIEMYLVPMTVSIMPVQNYKYTQLDVYDVRNGEDFTKFLADAQKLTREAGGVVIAGSSQFGRWLPKRRPMFIYVAQWCNMADYEKLNKQLQSIIPGCGATCVYRVVFPLQPLKTPFC